MSSSGIPEKMFVVAWAFQVSPENQKRFEHAYGPAGDWVRLFRSGDGYLKTELHRDPEASGRYITLDFWRTREQYESFRHMAKPAYQEIDAKCERLTQNEQWLGEFRDIASLRAAFHQLGPQTQVELAHVVRGARADDVSEIIRLEQAAVFAAHWTPPVYDAVFQANAAARIALVAENPEQRVCGFLFARVVADECELENIVVDGGETRRGIGSALLQNLLLAARELNIRRIFLEVRESNLPARRLYKKLGFTRDGERSSYYSDPIETAILYSLTL